MHVIMFLLQKQPGGCLHLSSNIDLIPFIRLTLHHLPNLENVFFQVGDESEALDKAELKHTHLIAWFVLSNSNWTAARSKAPFPQASS